MAVRSRALIVALSAAASFDARTLPRYSPLARERMTCHSYSFCARTHPGTTPDLTSTAVFAVPRPDRRSGAARQAAQTDDAGSAMSDILTGVSHKMTTPVASHFFAYAFINMRLRVGAGADATLHLPVTCVSTILDTCRPSRRERQKVCQGERDYKTKNENADDQIAGSNCAGHPTLSLRLGNTHA